MSMDPSRARYLAIDHKAGHHVARPHPECPDCTAPARCEYCGAVGELAPGSIYCGPCELARRPEYRYTRDQLAIGAWNDRQLASSPAPTGGPCNRSTGLCDGTCPDARAYHYGEPCTGAHGLIPCPGAVEYGTCHCGCCPAPASTSDRAELVTCPDCHVTNLMVDGAPLVPVNDCRCPEYVETRRGTIALAELAPAEWIWSTGFTQGTAGSRAYAITDAYITLVRASSPAPEWTF